jgi:anti-anti-sigma factor
MHFSTDQQDATTVFRLKEERLDSRNAGHLKAEFLILSQPDIDTLIIDLSEVRHVDSAGLSALLLAHRQMATHEGDVRLVGANADVKSLLRVTQLDRIFPLFNTVNEALDAEPSFGGEDEDDLENEADARDESDVPLAPGAPSANEIRAGAIAAGGSFGAAAISRIMMTPYEEELDGLNVIAFGDEENYDDEEEDLDDDLDDDFEEDEDVAEEDDDDDEEEDDVEEVEGAEKAEGAEEEADAPEEDDVLEDDDFEDDDLDDEELEEDEDEDY